jgi:predicted P-loop ATPase
VFFSSSLKDINNEQLFSERDDKQKWSYWPVRLYKAGKCMWLFNQNDYYQSLKKLAYYIKNIEKEKLDYFSHTLNSKADVLEQWTKMEQKKSA